MLSQVILLNSLFKPSKCSQHRRMWALMRLMLTVLQADRLQDWHLSGSDSFVYFIKTRGFERHKLQMEEALLFHHLRKRRGFPHPKILQPVSYATFWWYLIWIWEKKWHMMIQSIPIANKAILKRGPVIRASCANGVSINGWYCSSFCKIFDATSDSVGSLSPITVWQRFGDGR